MADHPATGELQPSKTRDDIIREAKRLEETTLYSSKGHHNAAAGWRQSHLLLGIPTVILSTVVGAAAFTEFSKEYAWVAILAGVLAILVAILSALTTFLNPNEKEAAHVSAAHAFDTLNNEARLFWSIECWGQETEDVLTAKLRTLIDKKNDLNRTSPRIPRRAYDAAKAGIAKGEAAFEVDRVELPKVDAKAAAAINKPSPSGELFN